MKLIWEKPIAPNQSIGIIGDPDQFPITRIIVFKIDGKHYQIGVCSEDRYETLALNEIIQGQVKDIEKFDAIHQEAQNFAKINLAMLV